MNKGTWTCDHCERLFQDANAVRQHHNKKHRGKKLSGHVKKHFEAFEASQEPSIADRMIDAELDHAMGIENPDYDWLVEPWK